MHWSKTNAIALRLEAVFTNDCTFRTKEKSLIVNSFGVQNAVKCDFTKLYYGFQATGNPLLTQISRKWVWHKLITSVLVQEMQIFFRGTLIRPPQLLNCQWNSCDIDDCQMLKYQSSQSYKVWNLLDLSFWSWGSWEYACLCFWWLIF